MLGKRCVITNGDRLVIQNDSFQNLSKALSQPWSQRMQGMSQQVLPHRGALLTNFYWIHDYLLYGDDKSLDRANELLDEVAQSPPEFTHTKTEKVLVDIMHHS